jgi:hypothetical protein
MLQVPDSMVEVEEPKARAQEEPETPVGAICGVCICVAGGIVCMVMSCILIGRWKSFDGVVQAGVSVMLLYGICTCIGVLLGIYALLIAICDGLSARGRVHSVPPQ